MIGEYCFLPLPALNSNVDETFPGQKRFFSEFSSDLNSDEGRYDDRFFYSTIIYNMQFFLPIDMFVVARRTEGMHVILVLKREVLSMD